MMKDDEDLPLMANRGQTPYIPTGYEGLQSSVQRKRRIGEALMAQGLKGPGDNVRSWAQVLGSLAQTWAGKSIQKDADKEEAETQQKMQAEIASANQAYAEAVQTGKSDEEIYSTLGSNPWLKDKMKIHETAISTRKKNELEGTRTEVWDEGTKSFKTVVIDKTGGSRVTGDSFALPPKIDMVNGVATATQRLAPGTVGPQDFSKKVITGPDGKALKNQAAIDADVKVAAAGADNSKITVNTAEDYSKIAADELKQSKSSATAAINTIGIASRLRKALATGKASTGPWSGWKNYAEKALGINKEGVAQRRILEQGLSQVVLEARQYLQGQGAVSNYEGQQVERAASGNIDEMTPQEIGVVIDELERAAKLKIEAHNDQIDAAKGISGTAQFLPSFQLPEVYRRDKTVRKAPAPARKGLPPKGAGVKPAVRPKSRFDGLLPPPAGGR
jgi:hypothetical protein